MHLAPQVAQLRFEGCLHHAVLKPSLCWHLRSQVFKAGLQADRKKEWKKEWKCPDLVEPARCEAGAKRLPSGCLHGCQAAYSTAAQLFADLAQGFPGLQRLQREPGSKHRSPQPGEARQVPGRRASRRQQKGSKGPDQPKSEMA